MSQLVSTYPDRKARQVWRHRSLIIDWVAPMQMISDLTKSEALVQSGVEILESCSEILTYARLAECGL